MTASNRAESAETLHRRWCELCATCLHTPGVSVPFRDSVPVARQPSNKAKSGDQPRRQTFTKSERGKERPRVDATRRCERTFAEQYGKGRCAPRQIATYCAVNVTFDSLHINRLRNRLLLLQRYNQQKRGKKRG